jgi:O-antigen/teichoic acid export membrane protein
MSESSPPRAPLRARIARAAFASGGSEVVTRVVMIAVSIFTARLLEPREVGLLGVAVIITSIVSMIGYYPEIAAVSLDRHHDDNAVAMASTIARSIVVIALLAVILGAYPVLARWVGGAPSGLEELGFLLRVLSLTVLVEAASGYPRVVLQRRLDLNFVAVTQLAQLIVYVALAIFFLSRGGRTASLAAAQVAGSAAAGTILWIRLLHLRFEALRWPLSDTWRETIRHSRRIFVGLIPGFISERVDNILVAGAIGAREMSFYSMAWNASHAPASIFNRAISFVLIPTLSHIRDEPERVQRAIEDCLRYAYLLLAPVCALLAGCAEPIVAFVLGPKWLPVVPCLRIMSVGVLTAPGLYVCAALLIGTGRAQLTAISTAIHIAILMIIIPTLARRWGVVGAAYGELIAVTILMITVSLTVHVSTRMLHAATALTPVVPVIAAAIGGAAAWRAALVPSTPFVQCVAGTLAMAVVYPLLVILLGGRAHLVALLQLLRGLIPRSAAAQAGS